MGIRKKETPRSKIKGVLRTLFLRSRERNAAVKAANNCCNKCGRKGSKAKGREVSTEVHHKHGICNWDEIICAIYKYLLCDPKYLEVLCKECHKKETEEQRSEDPEVAD